MFENLSPRLATSYNISQDGKWKLNSSIGRYYKIPTYTMLGFRDNKGIYINKNLKYTQSDHFVIGIEHNFSNSSRFTIEGFIKNYSQYPVSIIDRISLANKGGGFEVLGNEPVSDDGSGESYGLEFLFQMRSNLQ